MYYRPTSMLGQKATGLLGLADCRWTYFFDMVVINMQINVPGKLGIGCNGVGALFYRVDADFLPLAPAGATPVVMVLGDSLVAGHGLPQGQLFPMFFKKLATDGIDVTMINAGVSGDTTAAGWRGLMVSCRKP